MSARDVLDAMTDFFVLHDTTCSAVANLTVGGALMTWRCPVCQQERRFPVSEDDAREVIRMFNDDAGFAALIKAARRRIIQ